MSLALFPGWRPDADAHARLGTLAQAAKLTQPRDAPALKVRRPDQWHVTLCFAGYDLQHLVSPQLLQAFADAATEIPSHQFELERLAYWPGSGAVVALPFRSPELQALCDASHRALRRCGIKPMLVTHQPHVTLAYLDEHLPPQPWLDDVDYSDTPLHVERFELLFNPGGRYEALGCWDLTGSELPPQPEQATLF